MHGAGADDVASDSDLAVAGIQGRVCFDIRMAELVQGKGDLLCLSSSPNHPMSWEPRGPWAGDPGMIVARKQDRTGLCVGWHGLCPAGHVRMLVVGEEVGSLQRFMGEHKDAGVGGWQGDD